jgi:hypothetical protein
MPEVQHPLSSGSRVDGVVLGAVLAAVTLLLGIYFFQRRA